MERLAGRSAADFRKPAVNAALAGCHEAAVRRREKGGHRPDLRRIGHALERIERGEELHALLAQRCLCEVGRSPPGRQHVYPDAGALQVLRPGPREVAHCRLARAVGAHCRGARGAGARSGQDNRTALAHQRQRLLDREDRTLHIGVEGFVNVLGGDLAERKLASHPGIGENECEGAALGLHRRVESVEVGQIGDRALHSAGIGPEVGHSGVERFLPAAENEDEGALLDEALCCGAADAGSATGDHGGLSRQFLSVIITHIFSSLFLFFVILKMWDLRFSYKADMSSSSPNSNKFVTSSWARSAADKAKLLLHYGSRIVAIKGYDLSSLEVKNIDTRDIYCHARGSYSFRTKGQLTFMRY